MAVLKWETTILLHRMIVIIYHNTPNALLLSVVLGPRVRLVRRPFYWALKPVSIASYAKNITNIISNRPLLAEAILNRHLDMNGRWVLMGQALCEHFGGNIARSSGDSYDGTGVIYDTIDEAADLGPAVVDSVLDYSQKMDVDVQFEILSSPCQSQSLWP
ncbi:hypothetical protein PENANT_c015G04074 [Penicillium antarcticum]|uniref:Uncharacterized protein n=1 Tax=Penicillium antarcticum TaxID=416450 RepID=A0A1V6Q3N9_9EURO|nr:hypothetical protein PENANT_c015G04074 [Penicillium antarcticum]